MQPNSLYVVDKYIGEDVFNFHFHYSLPIIDVLSFNNHSYFLRVHLVITTTGSSLRGSNIHFQNQTIHSYFPVHIQTKKKTRAHNFNSQRPRV